MTAEATAADREEAHGRGLERSAAVAIILVTLLAAVFAYFQSQAGNRSARAARAAEGEGIRARRLDLEATRRINQDDFALDLSIAHGWLRSSMNDTALGGGPAAPYAAARGRAHGVVEQELGRHSTQFDPDPRYLLPDGTLDYQRFRDEQYRPSMAAAELELAYADEAGGWGAKASRYVTVITVLAVALFLLGLSTTVQGGARVPFVAVGSAVALVATVWGGAIRAGGVPSPSRPAIAAYVDAEIASRTARGPEDMRRAAARFGDAIRARPDYGKAYFGRAGTRYDLQLATAGSSDGFRRARGDVLRALDLGVEEPETLALLGSAEWWLGNYGAAMDAYREALEEAPHRLSVRVFQARAALTLHGRRSAPYRRQIAEVRRLLEDSPSWLRDRIMPSLYGDLETAIRARPRLAPDLAAMRERVLRIHHQVDVCQELLGEPTCPPVDATMGPLTWDAAHAGEPLRASFDFSGVEPDQTWLFRVYVDGVHREELSLEEPEPWELGPEGRRLVEIGPLEGTEPGQVVRLEIFLEGNLLTAGEVTIE